MNTLRIENAPTHANINWTPFPGGELEGPRSRAVCQACREKARHAGPGGAQAGPAALCFQCYRVDLDRNRKIKAAAELNTASEARFQTALPFEPVNVSRLARLKAEREADRQTARTGAGGYIEKRRRAQIQARHALARILQGVKRRGLGEVGAVSAGAPALESVVHAAELQLPESWLPFVVSR
ncbi:MAG TPA: hypothetical protein VM032_17810 [Vicinamibacterales bacterium]|nr:hypothetical protein [Vicinamibacterales bacterium]